MKNQKIPPLDKRHLTGQVRVNPFFNPSLSVIITAVFAVVIMGFGESVRAETVTVCESGCSYTTIKAALNSATSQGDIIEILDSRIYDEDIFWNANGDADNYIVLRAQAGQTPTIMDYIWLTGSYLQLGDGPGYGTIIVSSDHTGFYDVINMGSSGHHNIVKHVEVNWVYSGVGIYIPEGSHNNLIDNVIMDNIDYNRGADGQGASGIRIRGDNNIIQNCTLHTWSHDNIGIETSSAHHNKILNNYFDNAWGHGIAFSQYSGGYSSYTLIEGNTFENIASLGTASKNCIQMSGTNHITIRKNIFKRPYHRVFEISAYSSGSAVNEEIWIYNNVFYDIGWQVLTESSTGVVQHNVAPPAGSGGTINNIKWYNNILEKVGQSQTQGQGFWDEPFYAVWILAYYTGNDAGCGESGLISNDWNGNILKNNCLRVYYNGAYRTDYDHTIYYMGAGGSACDVWYTATGVNGIGAASGNIVNDPLFNNAEGGDFTLQSNSPCIDAGVVVDDTNATTGGWEQLAYLGIAPDMGSYEYSSEDLTPPSRSNPQPTGTLSSGTTSIIISLDTDETAVCKYSVIANTNYNDMSNVFATTDSTDHSTDVTDLEDGNSYTYYVKCQDESNNQNTDDFEISFSVASSTTYSISNFINLVSDWLKSESGLESDVNGDGIVNTRDLGIMMSNWGE